MGVQEAAALIQNAQLDFDSVAVNSHMIYMVNFEIAHASMPHQCYLPLKYAVGVWGHAGVPLQLQ